MATPTRESAYNHNLLMLGPDCSRISSPLRHHYRQNSRWRSKHNHPLSVSYFIICRCSISMSLFRIICLSSTCIAATTPCGSFRKIQFELCIDSWWNVICLYPLALCVLIILESCTPHLLHSKFKPLPLCTATHILPQWLHSTVEAFHPSGLISLTLIPVLPPPLSTGALSGKAPAPKEGL